MAAPRFIIVLLLLLSSALPRFLCAAERLEVEIRSNILNIRELRSTNSPVVGSLRKGDRLTVTTTDQRDWIRLDDGRGFISIHYVNVLSRTPVPQVPEPEAPADYQPPSLPPAQGLTTTRLDAPSAMDALTPVDSAQTEPLIEPIQDQTNADNDKPEPGMIDIKSVSKTCRKNLRTSEYESCQLLFTLQLADRAAPTTNITCSAEALATAKDKTQTLYELTSTRSVSQTVSETSVIVEWSPAPESAGVTRMALKAGLCQFE